MIYRQSRCLRRRTRDVGFFGALGDIGVLDAVGDVGVFDAADALGAMNKVVVLSRRKGGDASVLGAI